MARPWYIGGTAPLNLFVNGDCDAVFFHDSIGLHWYKAMVKAFRRRWKGFGHQYGSNGARTCSAAGLTGGVWSGLGGMTGVSVISPGADTTIPSYIADTYTGATAVMLGAYASHEFASGSSVAANGAWYAKRLIQASSGFANVWDEDLFYSEGQNALWANAADLQFRMIYIDSANMPQVSIYLVEPTSGYPSNHSVNYDAQALQISGDNRLRIKSWNFDPGSDYVLNSSIGGPWATINTINAGFAFNNEVLGLCGMQMRRSATAGLSIFPMGWSGAKPADLLNTAYISDAYLASWLSLLGANLVIIGLGVNGIGGGTTAQNQSDYLMSCFDRIQAAAPGINVIILGVYPYTGDLGAPSALNAILRTAVAAKSPLLGFLDIEQIWPATFGTTNWLVGPPHPKDADGTNPLLLNGAGEIASRYWQCASTGLLDKLAAAGDVRTTVDRGDGTLGTLDVTADNPAAFVQGSRRGRQQIITRP